MMLRGTTVCSPFLYEKIAKQEKSDIISENEKQVFKKGLYKKDEMYHFRSWRVWRI